MEISIGYKKLFRTIVPVIFLIIIGILFLIYFARIGKTESFNVVLGIILGVLTGFLADMSKRSWDKYAEQQEFKKIVLKLLEQDAKSIFQTFEMYDGIQKSRDKPGAPPGIENYLPPRLEMKYWDRLSNKDEFLILAEDETLQKIFREFWNFEKLNNLMIESENKKDEKPNIPYGFALAISKQILKDRSHENFLSLFLNQEEVEKYKENWRKKI